MNRVSTVNSNNTIVTSQTAQYTQLLYEEHMLSQGTWVHRNAGHYSTPAFSSGPLKQGGKA